MLVFSEDGHLPRRAEPKGMYWIHTLLITVSFHPCGAEVITILNLLPFYVVPPARGTEGRLRIVTPAGSGFNPYPVWRQTPQDAPYATNPGGCDVWVVCRPPGQYSRDWAGVGRG